MHNINNSKKALLLLWTYIIIFFTPKIKSLNNKNEILFNDNYISNNEPFATYKNKDIYIVDLYTAKMKKNLDTNSIYIIDDRKDKDPDMSVCNSYKYKNMNDIQNIIKILEEYEKQYPSIWNRSLKSMKNEWLIHNICYYLNLEKERTEQVDFNNKDEEIYLSLLNIIKEIIISNNDKQYLENILNDSISNEINNNKIKK